MSKRDAANYASKFWAEVPGFMSILLTNDTMTSTFYNTQVRITVSAHTETDSGTDGERREAAEREREREREMFLSAGQAQSIYSSLTYHNETTWIPDGKILGLSGTPVLVLFSRVLFSLHLSLLA